MKVNIPLHSLSVFNRLEYGNELQHPSVSRLPDTGAMLVF
jgi:hypothetical protein